LFTDTDGTLWDECDVDVCNGVTIDGEYSYVSTVFFPYTVGCWGPGNALLNVEASCSSEARLCDDDVSRGGIFSKNAIILSSFSFFLISVLSILSLIIA